MAFDYSKNVKGKDEKAQALKIQQQAVAKSKTTTPTQKKEAPKLDLIKPLVSAPAKVEAAAKKFLSAATFGLTDVLTNAYQPQKTAQLEQTAKEQPVVSTIATGLGYLSPGTAGTKLVKPLVSKAVTKTGSKLAGNVLEGALVGTGITAAENVAPVATGQKSAGQAAKEVGTGLILGAGLDVGLYGLGKVAKPLLDKIKLGKALTQAEKVEVAKSANVEVSKIDDLIKKSVEPKASKLQQIAKELEQPQIFAKAGKIVETSKLQREKGLEGALRELGPLPVKVERQKALDSALKQIELDSKVKQELPSMNKPAVEATQPLTELVKPLVDTNVDEGLASPKIDLNEPKPKAENRFNPQVETPEGVKLSKFNETAANSPVTGDELVKKINSNPVVYKPTTRAGQVEVAKKVVDEDFEAAVQMVRSGDKFKSEIENAVGLEVFKKLQEQGRYDDAFEVISALSKKGTAAGKDIESFKIWSTSTPEGLQRWAAKTLEATTTKPDPKIIAEVGDRMKLVQSSNPEQLANEVVGRIKNKTEQKAFLAATKGKDAEQLRAIATAQIMSDVFKKINPQELTQKTMAQGRKLSSFQSISQLLSLVTFQRNLYGNLINLGAEQLAKYPAAAADSVASLFTKQRSISGSAPKWKQSINQGLEQSKTSIAEILAGVQRNTGDKNEVIVQPAFANIPILKEMEKALSLSLTTPDELFKGFVASDSMYNQLRARIGKEADNMSLDEIKKALTAEEFETAIEEAKFATFQNDSLPSVLLTKLKNVLNIVGYGGEKYKTKEFGLGDLVIKYTKVPGNIIARGVEFSPVGYAKAISKLAQIKDVKSQREFAQAFGRATTGTGLMSLGAMLYDQGLIVGEEAGLSAREKGLSTAEGKRGFKLNISALSRLASGGDAKIQPTDTLISFDALQPVTIPITVGANIQEEAKKGGLSKNKVASKVSEKTFNEVLDLPALYTINQIYNESRKEGSTAFDVMTVPVKEAVSGFVPALVRQTAQTIDPVVRETKGADSTETAKNKVLAQIPFASKKLEPKITPTGKESKRDLGGLSAFLDPFKTTEYKPTGYTDKLKAIKELSGETKQFLPTVAPSTITIGKEKITLTAAEKTKYMKIVGSYLDEQYTKVLQNVNTSDLNPAKAKNLSDRLSKLQEQAREKAKLEIKKGR